MAHPAPNLAVNGSFESWYQDGGWQHFPSDFVRIGSDDAPYGNMYVDPDGAGINGAPEGVTLEVLDGQHSLKMWGMYAGGQDMWGSVYQTHSVESLGGVGSMFEAHVGVMSHEYDWIGTGTNYTTIFAEYYSVDDLGVVTYIDTIESNPFDGTFAASIWHEIGLDGVIPDGATHVDIGVIFYQENNDQNGSVYYDDLNIRHYGHDIYPDPQALALQVNKRDMTQINGYNLRTAIPMGYFEEYIPTNTSRNHDMVMMGYKLYRDNVAIDTLDIESDYYYDMVGVEGMYEYAISAMYHDVDQGSMEEAMSQMVMGNLTNNAPTIPTLLLPLDNTTITLSDENVVTDELVIQWDPATDTDLDLVEYTLQLCIDGQDICIDTNTVETYVFIPYSYLYDVITDLGVNVLNVTWSVHASDGWETVSSLSRSLVVDAGWMLSADEDLLPKVFALHNNYPNPFNPITNISYDIPELSNVRIEIFNLAGQKVRTLVSKQHQPGRYKVQWNATNQFGAPVSSGMYIYKIHAKGFSDVKKLLLMK